MAISPIITPSIFFAPLLGRAARGFLHYTGANITRLLLSRGTKAVPEIFPLRLDPRPACCRTCAFVLTLNELVEVLCYSLCTRLDTLPCCRSGVSCLCCKIGRCNLRHSSANPNPRFCRQSYRFCRGLNIRLIHDLRLLAYRRTEPAKALRQRSNGILLKFVCTR